MRRRLKLFVCVIISLALFAGCATMPLGPRVTVMPAVGKPLEMFQQEDKECKEWAIHQMGGEKVVQEAQGNAAAHAVVGALLGAAIGALIGAGTGQSGAGAAIGAGAGLAGGAASGAATSATSAAELQRLYDIAYAQCMYTKGNQVGQ